MRVIELLRVILGSCRQAHPKRNGQKGQQMSKTIQLQSKVNSVIVRLHVATTWFELSCCPLIYLRIFSIIQLLESLAAKVSNAVVLQHPLLLTSGSRLQRSFEIV